jgi:hypothetical protein
VDLLVLDDLRAWRKGSDSLFERPIGETVARRLDDDDLGRWSSRFGNALCYEASLKQRQLAAAAAETERRHEMRFFVEP